MPRPTAIRERQNKILALVNERGVLESATLATQLRVSQATVQSDLKALARQNCLRLVQGGAVRLGYESDLSPAFCNSTVTYAHAPVLLVMTDGSLRQACCPHCGLMSLIAPHTEVATVQVTDVLSGMAVAAQAATYVFEPELHVCCTPTVLAFASRHDAERFSVGFGGQVATLDEALDLLRG
jgi:DeoR family transcriptional regulator, copper-sensing transcriptional repressor